MCSKNCMVVLYQTSLVSSSLPICFFLFSLRSSYGCLILDIHWTSSPPFNWSLSRGLFRSPSISFPSHFFRLCLIISYRICIIFVSFLPHSSRILKCVTFLIVMLMEWLACSVRNWAFLNARDSLATRKIIKNSNGKLSHQHENGNVLNRTSMDVHLFNTNLLDEI